MLTGLSLATGCLGIDRTALLQHKCCTPATATPKTAGQLMSQPGCSMLQSQGQKLLLFGSTQPHLPSTFLVVLHQDQNPASHHQAQKRHTAGTTRRPPLPELCSAVKAPTRRPQCRQALLQQWLRCCSVATGSLAAAVLSRSRGPSCCCAQPDQPATAAPYHSHLLASHTGDDAAAQGGQDRETQGMSAQETAPGTQA